MRATIAKEFAAKQVCKRTWGDIMKKGKKRLEKRKKRVIWQEHFKQHSTEKYFQVWKILYEKRERHRQIKLQVCTQQFLHQCFNNSHTTECRIQGRSISKEILSSTQKQSSGKFKR